MILDEEIVTARVRDHLSKRSLGGGQRKLAHSLLSLLSYYSPLLPNGRVLTHAQAPRELHSSGLNQFFASWRLCVRSCRTIRSNKTAHSLLPLKHMRTYLIHARRSPSHRTRSSGVSSLVIRISSFGIFHPPCSRHSICRPNYYDVCTPGFSDSGIVPSPSETGISGKLESHRRPRTGRQFPSVKAARRGPIDQDTRRSWGCSR
jgi:hypothetical protein